LAFGYYDGSLRVLKHFSLTLVHPHASAQFNSTCLNSSKRRNAFLQAKRSAWQNSFGLRCQRIPAADALSGVDAADRPVSLAASAQPMQML